MTRCRDCGVPFDIADLDDNLLCRACAIIAEDDSFTEADDYNDAAFEEDMLDDFIVFHNEDWT